MIFTGAKITLHLSLIQVFLSNHMQETWTSNLLINYLSSCSISLLQFKHNALHLHDRKDWPHKKHTKLEFHLRELDSCFGNIPPGDPCLTEDVVLQVASVDLRAHYYWKGSPALHLLQTASLGTPLLQSSATPDHPARWRVKNEADNSFAEVHAKVCLCHWWNFPQETRDPLLFSSHFWKTRRKLSAVIMNNHENPTKCNSRSKTTVQVHNKGLSNNLKSAHTSLQTCSVKHLWFDHTLLQRFCRNYFSCSKLGRSHQWWSLSSYFKQVF